MQEAGAVVLGLWGWSPGAYSLRCESLRRFLQVDRSSESLFFPTGQSLTYLDGSLPADFGFDPLGLSDPEGAGGLINPAWLSYACVPTRTCSAR